MSYQQFLATLERDQPPEDAEVALRALWYDAKGRAASAERAANFEDSYACKRVRAYLARKSGDVHQAQLWYYRSGAPKWEGSIESEWEDIVHCILIERPVSNAYT